MFHETGLFSENAKLKHEQLLRQLFAFVVTASSVFLLLSLFWPMTASRFRSHTKILVRVGEGTGAEQEFQNVLATAIRARTTDVYLENLIEQAGQQAELRSPVLVTHDFSALRNSLSVRTRAVESKASVQLEFAFEGNGSSDEQHLIRCFRNEIATALIKAAHGSAIESDLAIESNGSAKFRPQFEKLEWLLQQVENDFSAVQEYLTEVAPSDDNVGPFLNASHVRTSQSGVAGDKPGLHDVQQALGSIDLASLREQLNHLKNSLDIPTNDARNELGLEGSAKTIPVNVIPSRIQFLMLGMFACVVGSVVATNYGAFADRGFSNVNRVAALLRIPVIATLQLNGQSGGNEKLKSNLPWANRIVQISKLYLLGMAVLVGGFCFINPAVRGAFLENPFYGFSKLVWVFWGN